MLIDAASGEKRIDGWMRSSMLVSGDPPLVRVAAAALLHITKGGVATLAILENARLKRPDHQRTSCARHGTVLPPISSSALPGHP